MPHNNVQFVQIPLASNSPAECTNTPVAQPTLGRSHEEHQAIASEWLQRALKGIMEMHENEDVRKDVARRLF